MAHAGGTRPSVEMSVVAGKLVIGTRAQRLKVVDNVDLAVQRLLNGEVVYVQMYGALPDQVRRTIEMALGEGGQG